MLWLPSSKTGFFLGRRLANGTKKMHPWQWQSSIVVKCESFHFRSLLLHQLLGKLLSLLCSRSGAIFLLARIAPSLLLWAWEVKGGLISESLFYIGSNINKKLPNYTPEHFPFSCKVLRRVIWQLYLEMWAKVKNFLRLSCTFREQEFVSINSVQWGAIIYNWKSLPTYLSK